MVLSAAAVLGSHSRGALLAVGAMSLLLWWRSPRKVLFGIPMLAAAIALLAFMPENWVSRMESIRNYEEDSSATARINGWLTMFNLANDRLLGGGFANYTPDVYYLYSPDPSRAQAAHSIYFDVLGGHGWIGLALFLTLWLLTWRSASALRRQTKGKAEFSWVFHLAGMSQVSLVGYAVGGAFLSLAYFDLPYNILVIIVATQRWLSQTVATAGAASKSSPGSMIGARRGDLRS
jgi:probable O-glycosylation ligase (exosortase A-associated)